MRTVATSAVILAGLAAFLCGVIVYDLRNPPIVEASGGGGGVAHLV